MFSNRFNTKNDPILEAVEGAMKDGALRRQAEAIVNEEFGVYSRNAVVREDLNAYDATLDEVYAALKEGVQIDELKKPTPETAKKVVDRSENSDEWSAKAHNRLYDRYKKGYEKPETKKEVKEEQAKKDYDKDGKIESGKDEVWGSRLRAAKMAGKLKEGTAAAETSMSVTKDNKPSTPAQTNASTSGPSASDKAALSSKIKGLKEAAYSAKAGRAGKDLGKPGKNFSKIAKKAGEKYGSEERGKKVAGAILKRIRAKHMKEEQIDEIVVQKSQMRPGETLGMAMNRLTGKTAIKGGANDPTSSKFKSGAQSGPSISDAPKTPAGPPAPTSTSASTRQPGAPDETSTQKFLSKNLGTAKSTPAGPKMPAGPEMSDAPAPPTASTPASVPLPPRKPVAGPSMPAPSVDPGAAENAKRKAGGPLEESVQVGVNKYRIV